MAGSDYLLCERCGRKTIYDAEIEYGRNVVAGLCELCVAQGARLTVTEP